MHCNLVAISRFEDIESWQQARELGAEVHGLSTRGEFSKNFSLRDQIQRACISIMANIAEGFGRNTTTEFIRYLQIAQASTLEVQSHLYIALDLRYITRTDFDLMHARAETVRKLIGGLIRYLMAYRQNHQIGARNQKPATKNQQPRTSNQEPATKNQKLRTRN